MRNLACVLEIVISPGSYIVPRIHTVHSRVRVCHRSSPDAQVGAARVPAAPRLPAANALVPGFIISCKVVRATHHPPSHLGFPQCRQLAALDAFHRPVLHHHAQKRDVAVCVTTATSETGFRLGWSDGFRASGSQPRQSTTGDSRGVVGAKDGRAKIPKFAALNPTVTQAHVHGKPAQFPASHSLRPECRLGRLAPKIINTNGVRARATSVVYTWLRQYLKLTNSSSCPDPARAAGSTMPSSGLLISPL